MDRNVVGIGIAFVILIIYVGLVGYMIFVVADSCVFNQACTASPATTFNDRYSYFATATTGLVSAFVTLRLALTPAGPKGQPSLGADQGGQAGSDAGLAWLYILAWFAVGAAAFVIGAVSYPDANSTLKDIGSGWFGALLAAGYAYFQVDPKKTAGG